MEISFALARYDTNGSLDVSFNSTGTITTSIDKITYATDVAIQPDGKIIAAGFIMSNNTATVRNFALARYNTDGSLDATFNSTGTVTTSIGPGSAVSSVALQNDGKIVVAGYIASGPSTTPTGFALARYTTDGKPDTTFNSTGTVTTSIGTSSGSSRAIIQPDGKIVAVGFSSSGNGRSFALARYNTDGTLDRTFNSTGIVVTPVGTDSYAYAVALQPDGKISVVGLSDGFLAVARYNQ
jgi:uncharacterized delta-60 repeat protein